MNNIERFFLDVSITFLIFKSIIEQGKTNVHVFILRARIMHNVKTVNSKYRYSRAKISLLEIYEKSLCLKLFSYRKLCSMRVVLSKISIRSNNHLDVHLNAREYNIG